MRISDWSSDVCSSDLCVTLQGFLIFEHYEARHAAFVEQMSAWLRDGQIAVVEDVIDGLEHATAGLIGLLRGDNFGKRSEEHTSELQSLMRISYAVFCLKQKKTEYKSVLASHSQD